VKDLSFLSDEERVVAAPMAIQGIVEGRAALAQRVMTMLLSSVDDPARTYTTGLLQEIGKSNVRNSEDLNNDFAYAVNNARTVIQNEQAVRTDLTDDDTLQDIIVESISAEVDKVSAVISIITVSGENLILNLEI